MGLNNNNNWNALGGGGSLASTSAPGSIQLATQAEADEGMEAEKAVTPATLAGTLAAQTYAIKTAAFTALQGNRYALDTSAGSLPVTIDSALPVGGFIDFADAFGTWNTNPPTFLRNGHLIEGAEVNYIDSAQGTFLRILNVGGTEGLRILEAGTKPHNLTIPTITGQYVGQAFTCTPGAWTGNPTAYVYQWQSSTDGATWADISGATSGSYTPNSVLLGAYIRVIVAASNSNGTSLPVASVSSVGLTAAPFPSGVIAYWRLDETTGTRADATGNGDTLSNTNSVGYVTGKIGNAAVFDQTNYLAGSISHSLSVFSISMWVNATDTYGSDGYGRRAVAGIRSAGDEAFWFGTDGPEAFFQDYDNQVSIRGSALSLSTWMHVAVTSDGGELKIYVNGVEVNSTTAGSSAITFDHFTAGCGSNGTSGDNWNGAIDEFGVWQRALSADEVTQLYNSGNGLAYSE